MFFPEKNPVVFPLLNSLFYFLYLSWLEQTPVLNNSVFVMVFKVIFLIQCCLRVFIGCACHIPYTCWSSGNSCDELEHHSPTFIFNKMKGTFSFVEKSSSHVK